MKKVRENLIKRLRPNGIDFDSNLGFFVGSIGDRIFRNIECPIS